MEEIHDEMVTLVDEEGQEHEFMVLDIIMVEEHKYAILIPALTDADMEDDDEQETEAVIFRFDEDEENLILVEDDDEFAAVAAAWEEMAMADDEDLIEE